MTTGTKKLDLKKLIVPIAAVAVVAVIILIIVLATSGGESYRLIKVNSFQGGVTLEREEKGNVSVFNGLQLISADTVAVGEGAFLELLADSDKHIAAEENTGFRLYSSGDEKSGNINIELLYGKALFAIEKKLSEGSFFQVSSPNATLSVRGTIFSVDYNAEEKKTVAEVTEGKVAVNYDGGEETLEPGDKITVIGTGSDIQAIVERAEGEASGTSQLLTFTITYPQTVAYTEDERKYSVAISEYVAEKVHITDMYCSDSTTGQNALLGLNYSLRETMNSHSDEIGSFFDANKNAAITEGKDAAKDVTEWVSNKLTVGGRTLIINKAVMNISVASDSLKREYFTSETHETTGRGGIKYYHADGVVIKFYGSIEGEKVVVTTAVPSSPTAPVTTTTGSEDNTTTTPVSTEAPASEAVSSDNNTPVTQAPAAPVETKKTTKKDTSSSSSYPALKTFNSDHVDCDAMMSTYVSYEVNSGTDGFNLMSIVLEDGGGLSDCMDDADWSGSYSNLASVAINGSIKNYESGKTKIKTGEGLSFMKSLMQKLTDTYLSRESEVQARYLKKYMKEKLKGIQEDDCLYSHSDMYGNGENIYDDVTSWFPKSIKVDTGDTTYKITFKKVGLHAQLTCDPYSAENNPDSPLIFKNSSTGEKVMITNVDYYFDYFVNIDEVN